MTDVVDSDESIFNPLLAAYHSSLRKWDFMCAHGKSAQNPVIEEGRRVVAGPIKDPAFELKNSMARRERRACF